MGGVLGFFRFPIEKRERPDDIDHHQLRRELVQLFESHASCIFGR